MHKNAMKCNKTPSKWCINKHGASTIIDTFETTYKSYTNVATSSKVPGSKELKKKAIERQTQTVAEIYQNRTADKDKFF
jgi:hypothetical protein